MTKIYDRVKKECYIEDEQGQELLEILYNTVPGRILLKVFFSNPIYSNLNAMIEKSRYSRKKIKPFIKRFSIDLKEYEKRTYRSFDDFFTRKKKESYLKIDKSEDALVSPCDCKLQVFDIDESLKLKIKGVPYKLGELLSDYKLADKYAGGKCLVFRLAVNDYHRYCFIDDGEVIVKRTIKGKLHTVRAIAAEEKVYKRNQREYAVLDGKRLGEHIYMEVGAIQIGKINNHSVHKFKKGQEKGYFSHGGSTIVLIVGPNKVKIDKDIIENSLKDTEVQVKYGEKVGSIVC